MGYTPKPPPKYTKNIRTPVSLDMLADVIQYIESELENVSRATLESLELELRTTSVEPKRPRNGMIVDADGIGWNPGAGAGLYVYKLGAWTLFSGAGSTGLTHPQVMQRISLRF